MRLWDVFLVHPWIALAIGCAFLVAWTYRRSALALVPAILWIVYAAYEWRMRAWSTTVIAPIRIDLLFIIPVLLIASVVAVVAMSWRPGCR